MREIVLLSWLAQIETQKLEWKTTSRVGSLDNATHKPGGGDKKVRGGF